MRGDLRSNLDTVDHVVEIVVPNRDVVDTAARAVARDATVGLRVAIVSGPTISIGGAGLRCIVGTLPAARGVTRGGKHEASGRDQIASLSTAVLTMKEISAIAEPVLLAVVPRAVSIGDLQNTAAGRAVRGVVRTAIRLPSACVKEL